MENSADERLPITLHTAKKPLTPTKEHPLQDLGTTTSEDEDAFCDIKPKVKVQNDENKNVIIQMKEDDNRNTTIGSDESKSNDDDDVGELDGENIVKSQQSTGKVVRRKKTSTSTNAKNANQRASFPMGKSNLNKSIERLEAQMANLAGDTDSSERLEAHNDTPVPEWVIVGESVLIRPYNLSGVISFIGATHFQVMRKEKNSRKLNRHFHLKLFFFSFYSGWRMGWYRIGYTDW